MNGPQLLIVCHINCQISYTQHIRNMIPDGTSIAHDSWSIQLNKSPTAHGDVSEESIMNRLITFAVVLIIFALPLVPARGAMQKTEAASDDGRILWQFDSGG
jgi:hypothetical protein